MQNSKQTDTSSNQTQSKSRIRQTEIPSMTIEEAMRIPIALRDNYALEPASPTMIGKAIGIAPTSGIFRTITGAAVAFGLTTGGYNATEIGLTDLGRRIVAPTEEGDDMLAKIEAFEKPRLIGEFVQKYNGKRLPQEAIVLNILTTMGVPFNSSSKVYKILLEGLEGLGYIQKINGTLMVERPREGASVVEQKQGDEDIPQFESGNSESKEDNTLSIKTPTTPTNALPNAIFLGHGKNKKPLEQLIKILDEYGIPHKQAIVEPNGGRPIPTKVADTLKQCGAAILIFTADEKFYDEENNEIWRPSENVIHELGAASILYDNRIIIFKEKDVTLASNYDSIGHITFEKDKLSDKGIDLFRELVNFKLVSIKVGS